MQLTGVRWPAWCLSSKRTLRSTLQSNTTHTALVIQHITQLGFTINPSMSALQSSTFLCWCRETWCFGTHLATSATGCDWGASPATPRSSQTLYMCVCVARGRAPPATSTPEGAAPLHLVVGVHPDLGRSSFLLPESPSSRVPHHNGGGSPRHRMPSVLSGSPSGVDALAQPVILCWSAFSRLRPPLIHSTTITPDT